MPQQDRQHRTPAHDDDPLPPDPSHVRTRKHYGLLARRGRAATEMKVATVVARPKYTTGMLYAEYCAGRTGARSIWHARSAYRPRYPRMRKTTASVSEVSAPRPAPSSTVCVAIARCSPGGYDRAKAALPAGFSSFGKSASALSDARYACYKIGTWRR